MTRVFLFFSHTSLVFWHSADTAAERFPTSVGWHNVAHKQARLSDPPIVLRCDDGRRRLLSWLGVPAELSRRPVCPATSWAGRQVLCVLTQVGSPWWTWTSVASRRPQGGNCRGGVDSLLMNCLVEQNCIMLVVFKRIWQVLKCAGWCCNLCCGDRIRTETAAADWGTKTVFFIHEQQR